MFLFAIYQKRSINFVVGFHFPEPVQIIVFNQSLVALGFIKPLELKKVIRRILICTVEPTMPKAKTPITVETFLFCCLAMSIRTSSVNDMNIKSRIIYLRCY